VHCNILSRRFVECSTGVKAMLFSHFVSVATILHYRDRILCTSALKQYCAKNDTSSYTIVQLFNMVKLIWATPYINLMPVLGCKNPKYD